MGRLHTAFPRTAFFLLTLIVLSMVGSVPPARAVGVEDPVSAWISHLRDEAEGVVDHAKDSGDYVIWSAAARVLGLIDAWEQANGQLMDQAFGSLTQERQAFFQDLDATLEKVNRGIGNHLAVATALSDSAAQIANDVNPLDNNAYILRYEPRVIVPGGDRDIRLTVRGINLQDADAQLIAPSGDVLDRLSPTRQELIFPISPDVFVNTTDQAQLTTLSLQYQEEPLSWIGEWMGIEPVSRDLTFLVLPQQMARYTVTTQVTRTMREQDVQRIHMGRFHGRNRRLDRLVMPRHQELGWRIDTTRRSEIRLHDEGADKGRCEGVHDHTITETSLTMYAHLDNRWSGGRKKDAWVVCSISIPVYRTSQQAAQGPTFTGHLDWTGQPSITLPQGVTAVQVQVTLFDGRTLTFGGTGTGQDRYLDVRREGQALIFRPRVPSDI